MKTLIIKLGALGDVVRTTVLLRELPGKIYWLTKKNAADLLHSTKITQHFFIENSSDIRKLGKMQFDLILSLDEERATLKILNGLKTKRRIGAFLDTKNKVDYTPEANILYRMSKISKLGKKKADLLKKQNGKTISEILFNMLGKKFGAQEYDLNTMPKAAKGTIGLINISTGIWPNKYWYGYEKLRDLLKEDGYEVNFLGMRNTLKEHIDDINNCAIIVCGDTLGMHIALALKKKVIALFNCTPPNEIYDYGRMVKIISPIWKKHFFSKTFSVEAIRAIPVSKVLQAVKQTLI